VVFLFGVDLKVLAGEFFKVIEKKNIGDGYKSFPSGRSSLKIRVFHGDIYFFDIGFNLRDRSFFNDITVQLCVGTLLPLSNS